MTRYMQHLQLSISYFVVRLIVQYIYQLFVVAHISK